MVLTPSQRVTLLKEIADRLAAEEWPLIDVTLKQFSLPSSESWQGSKNAYVLQMISGASDDVLVSLGQHAGFELALLRTGVDPAFWRRDCLRLFLSHLADHRSLAAGFQASLLEYGISTFVAHTDIEPTKEWQTEIETALATCDALIAFLHPGFHVSNWTDQEVGFAMGRGLPVFSVRFGQDPYGFIGRFQAFDGNNKSLSALAREVFDVLRRHKQTQRRMAEALVTLFADSYSFAVARERMGFLEELGIWDRSFAARLRTAVNTNSQISDAWGVRDRLESLIDTWEKRGI